MEDLKGVVIKASEKLISSVIGLKEFMIFQLLILVEWGGLF